MDAGFADLAQVPCGGADGYSLDDFTSRIERAARHGGWVVFCGHEVGDPAWQTTSASVLDELSSWLTGRRNEVWVATVADVAARIRGTREARRKPQIVI
jgi:hypothetical protein